MQQYEELLKEEIGEWKKIENTILKKGIPWWADLRRANISGKNIFWRNDPQKEKIIRGEEKKKILALASEKRGKILDLGCGSGWLSLELARKGMDVLGVDVSPDRIKIAKKFLKENPYKENFGHLIYRVGDLNKINFTEDNFDTVVVWDTLHHFPNLDEILEKIKFSLKPGGKFIVYDHIGNRYLKLSGKIFNFLTREKEKVVPYEDVLGKKMIDIIGRYFLVKNLYTRLAFPTSAILFLIFKYDVFLPLLPILVKIDKFLCDLRIFRGEYFFIYGQKK